MLNSTIKVSKSQGFPIPKVDTEGVSLLCGCNFSFFVICSVMKVQWLAMSIKTRTCGFAPSVPHIITWPFAVTPFHHRPTMHCLQLMLYPFPQSNSTEWWIEQIMWVLSRLDSIVIHSILFIYCLGLSGPSHNPEKLIRRVSHDCWFKIKTCLYFICLPAVRSSSARCTAQTTKGMMEDSQICFSNYVLSTVPWR